MSMVDYRTTEVDTPETGEDYYWSLAKCKRCYTDYLTSKTEEISEQKSSRQYRYGAQWTSGQVEKFNLRRQPVVTYNRIGRKIDAIVGLIEKLKQDPKAFPRNPRETDAMGAELATGTVQYVVSSGLKENVFPFAVDMGAMDGIGGVELLLEHDVDGKIDIGFALVRTESFFYDPCSIDHTFSDARYMGAGKWVDIEDAVALAPNDEIAESIRATAGYGSELTSDPDNDKHWLDIGTQHRRVRLVEIWYKHKGGWCWCLFTGGTKIREGKGYFFDEKKKQICKFIMFSAFVDHDGDRHGFVRTLRSSQDEVNQRRSKGLHELNSRRIKAEDGAFTDIEVARREAVRPDGVVIYNKGFEMEFDDAARIANVEGQLKFLEDAKNEIENFGPNPALIGQGLEYKSGRAINLLQQAGLAELGPFVINVKNWKLRLYRAIWNACQRYWTQEKWITINDINGDPQAVQLNGLQMSQMGFPQLVNQIARLDVNFIMDEGPDEVNMMADAYDTLVALTAQGANIPPQVLLELSPLQHSVKKKLLGMLNQKDPVQEQAKQIALAGEGAKVDETKSKTALNLAKAQETQQGGAHGMVERQMDAAIAQDEHQMKMQESAMKIQGEREKMRIKAASEFASLQSKRQQSDMDLRLKAAQGNQKLQQGEMMHQQRMRMAAQKPQGGNGAGAR